MLTGLVTEIKMLEEDWAGADMVEEEMRWGIKRW